MNIMLLLLIVCVCFVGAALISRLEKKWKKLRMNKQHTISAPQGAGAQQTGVVQFEDSMEIPLDSVFVD